MIHKNTDDIPGDIISIREACSLLPSSRPGRSLNIATMTRWILKGRLRGWRQGRFWFVARSDVVALLQAHVPNESATDQLTAMETQRRREDTARQSGLAKYCKNMR